MKHLIYIALFIVSVNCFSQDKQIVFKEINCESGKMQAIEDANNGKYKLITYGLIASTNWEFDKFYWQYVKDNYNVILGSGGCVVTEDVLCYSTTMKTLILEKFGQDFFEKVKKEAKQLYKKA